MEWDNAWGHTYAYYTPLSINGTEMGLIGTEIDVATVNHEILRNALSAAAESAFAVFMCSKNISICADV